ncbi:Diphthamide biosynthesis protein 2 [Toensbergia leucococca]|nr:Diphthamide biosynthesis protein 2 [Toensbergia leucococca]
MTRSYETPPVLSTPDSHVFEDPTPSSDIPRQRLSDEDILTTYEIEQTATQIRAGKWIKIALQFHDNMLHHAPRVFEALTKSLKGHRDKTAFNARPKTALENMSTLSEALPNERLYILADTSYGACCVDEIAAEHVGADVVVHYGRSCLSPTARLPVIHIFTRQPLAIAPLLMAFEQTYSDRLEKVILMADVIYSSHIPSLNEALIHRGYTNSYATKIIHDPSSPLPNRTIPTEIGESQEELKEWHLFHISDPPESLLLVLSSRVSTIHIYPAPESPSTQAPRPLLASSTFALRRRYALLTSVSTVSIFGILINTLSVKNYLHVVEHVKAQILAAGKKSYTFVVGKVNAAKVANFSEIGAWVVIGCWESSLIDSKDFWRPVLTPFELKLALEGDGERVWTGEWRSDFQGILNGPSKSLDANDDGSGHVDDGNNDINENDGCRNGEIDSDPESAPPEFDLRTGRYVSYSRPMQPITSLKYHTSFQSDHSAPESTSLIQRIKGEVAVVGGEVSPGAEHLRSKRTWKGLGSDFEIKYDEPEAYAGTTLEEGRSGIARGYTNGDESRRR